MPTMAPGRRSPPRPSRRTPGCWCGTRCRAAPRTRRGARWRPSSPAGASRRSSGWVPTPSSYWPSSSPPSRSRPSINSSLSNRFTTSARNSIFCCFWKPYRFRLAVRRKPMPATWTASRGRSSRRPVSSVASAIFTSRSFPALWATSLTSNSKTTCTPWTRPASALGLAISGRRLPALSPAGRDGDGVRSVGHPGRPRLLEGVLPAGGFGWRSRFAATTARQRLAEVDALVRAQGTPWFARYGFSKEELTTIRAAEGWHVRYGARGPAPVGSSTVAAVPGEVY